MKYSKLFLALVFVPIFFTSNMFAQQDKSKKKELALLEFVLSDSTLKLYRDMSDTEKAQWANRFWRAMDPTPTTEVNEYYKEFRKRIYFAAENYANLVPPYFVDDRGKYYIKYGRPDEHVESTGIGRSYRDNVTWAYYGLNLFIDFVDFEAYGYREVNDLSEAVRGAPINQRARIARELYMERISISEKYFSFRSGKSDMDFFATTQELNQIKQLALEKAPPAIYKFEHREEPLTVRLASCVFRETQNRNRLELYYSLPLQELKYKTSKSNLLLTHLKKDLIIYDVNYQPIVKRSEEIPLYARPGEHFQRRSYINQHNEELPPGDYHLAFQLENPESKRIAILKSQLKIRAFPPDKLSVSDIQLGHSVQVNPEGKYLKPNNIMVVPYISSVVDKQRKISVYFEIYNLTKNKNGRTNFRVEYEIRQVTKNENPITDITAKIASFFRGSDVKGTTGTSFESVGVNSFEQIYSALDFSSSTRGKKELEVKITDLISGEHTNKTIKFDLK